MRLFYHGNSRWTKRIPDNFFSTILISVEKVLFCTIQYFSLWSFKASYSDLDSDIEEFITKGSSSLIIIPVTELNNVVQRARWYHGCSSLLPAGVSACLHSPVTHQPCGGCLRAGCSQTGTIRAGWQHSWIQTGEYTSLLVDMWLQVSRASNLMTTTTQLAVVVKNTYGL